MRAIRLLLIVTCLAASCVRAPERPSVLVFAAASLKTALDEIATTIDRDQHITVTTSYAASSALAKQIDADAPADLFISADVDWMNDVATHGEIRPESRVDLLGNELVLIAPAANPLSLTLNATASLAAALHGERLAIANPDSVPAGKYGKAALTSLGLWDSVADHLAPAEDVRTALQLVSRGATPLGIVYRTDAVADRNVVVVAEFPPASHPPIVYPAALTRHASDAAARVLTYLEGADARAVFTRNGFIVMAR